MASTQDGALHIQDSVATPAGERLSRTEKTIIIMGSVVGIVLIVCFTYFFVLRDRWENQHRDSLIAITEEAEGLAKRGKLSDAAKKYDELFQEVGEHRIRDVSLQQRLDAARTSRAKIVADTAAQAEGQLLKAEAQRQQKERDQQRAALERDRAAEASRRAVNAFAAFLPVMPAQRRSTQKVDIEYDEFKDITTVDAPGIAADCTLDDVKIKDDKDVVGFNGFYLGIQYVFKGKTIKSKPEALTLTIWNSGNYTAFRFRQNHDDLILYMIVDGKRVELPVSNYEYGASGGYVSEFVSFKLPASLVDAIGKSNSVRCKLDVWGIDFTADQRNLCGDFVTMLRMAN